MGEIRLAKFQTSTHPASTTVKDLGEALTAFRVREVAIPELAGRVSLKLSLPRARLRSDNPVIIPMMGPRFDLLYASCARGVPVPVAWDVWEPAWPQWRDHIRRLRLPLVFATSSQSAEFLQRELPQSRIEWLPEAIQLNRYAAGDRLVNRTTDVLELGRKYDEWHDAVEPVLISAGARHLFEETPGALVFQDPQAMVRGLADSRISVCFPSSITHPARSGSVSTMTQRYLESLASGCLILGRAPDELVKFFGFDPVVSTSVSDPAEQLMEMLRNIERYQPLVDRARSRVLAIGDWSSRALMIMALVEETFAVSR